MDVFNRESKGGKNPRTTSIRMLEVHHTLFDSKLAKSIEFQIDNSFIDQKAIKPSLP